MKKSRFSEEQIVTALKQEDPEVAVDEVCRKYGISQQTDYRWRRQYGGVECFETAPADSFARLIQVPADEGQLQPAIFSF